MKSSASPRFAVLFLAAALVALPLLAQSPAPPDRDASVQTIIGGIKGDRLKKDIYMLAAFPTRHTLSGAKGADLAADALYKELQEIAQSTGGRLQVAKQTWTQPAGNRMPAPAQLTNVVATLPGTETPERIVVVSGHYDSRVTDVMNAISPAPGANDDASGVAVVLELARNMASYRFPCTVVFACVTGEEQGLYGSQHMADTFAAEKKNVVAMFTNDIVGNSRGEGGIKDDTHLRIFSAGYDVNEVPADATRRRAWGTEGETRARTLSRAATDAVRRNCKGFTLAQTFRNDRYGRGGDHTPFVNAGYAACRLTEPNEDWRHQHQDLRTEKGVQYGDLPEYMDYAYLARVAQANAAIISEIALSPAAPTRVSLKGDLSAQTTLTWEPSGDAMGYEILWRKTAAPDWESKKYIPAGTNSIVLPLSKDDYLFVVRGVAKGGARGLPTIPMAGR